MIDLFLKHGNRDYIPLNNADHVKDDITLAKLNHKGGGEINRKIGSPVDRSSFAGLSQVFPRNAVIINWHGQRYLE